MGTYLPYLRIPSCAILQHGKLVHHYFLAVDNFVVVSEKPFFQGTEYHSLIFNILGFEAMSSQVLLTI